MFMALSWYNLSFQLLKSLGMSSVKTNGNAEPSSRHTYETWGSKVDTGSLSEP